MRTKTKIFAALSALIMVFIFLMSSLDADNSQDLSDSITRIILNVIEPGEHDAASSAKESGDQSGFAAAEDGDTVPAGSLIPSFGGDYNPVPKNEWLGISRWRFKSFIRKTAHFLLFMLLGVFVLMTAVTHGGKMSIRYALLSIGVCIAYAMLDELHQLFVPGRGADIVDVAIDAVGAMIGIAAAGGVYAVAAIIAKRFSSNEKLR